VAGRRCAQCDIVFPATTMMTGVCPVHKTPLTYGAVFQPDVDWQDKLREVEAEMAREAVLATEEGELDALILTVDAKVRLAAGTHRHHYRILAWDVFPVAQRRMEATELLRIGAQVFEILGYVHQTREYIIRPFSTKLTEDDLRRLADGD
jgi:hypothetical protein